MTETDQDSPKLNRRSFLQALGRGAATAGFVGAVGGLGENPARAEVSLDVKEKPIYQFLEKLGDPHRFAKTKERDLAKYRWEGDQITTPVGKLGRGGKTVHFVVPDKALRDNYLVISTTNGFGAGFSAAQHPQVNVFYVEWDTENNRLGGVTQMTTTNPETGKIEGLTPADYDKDGQTETFGFVGHKGKPGFFVIEKPVMQKGQVPNR